MNVMKKKLLMYTSPTAIHTKICTRILAHGFRVIKMAMIAKRFIIYDKGLIITAKTGPLLVFASAIIIEKVIITNIKAMIRQYRTRF